MAFWVIFLLVFGAEARLSLLLPPSARLGGVFPSQMFGNDHKMAFWMIFV